MCKEGEAVGLLRDRKYEELKNEIHELRVRLRHEQLKAQFADEKVCALAEHLGLHFEYKPSLVTTAGYIVAENESAEQ